MPSDLNKGNFFLVGQFTNLESIPRGDGQLKPAGTQFIDDGLEEDHMRRIVQINPNGQPQPASIIYSIPAHIDPSRSEIRSLNRS
jgi:hypothetical protein